MRLWPPVVAVLAGLVLLLQAIFPLAAVDYAQRLYGASSVVGGSEPAVPEESSSSKMDDLGVRTLPLISDEAWSVYQADPETAIQTYGQKALGDSWADIWNSAPADFNDLYEYAFHVGASIDYGSLEVTIGEAMNIVSPGKETDVLDLIGVLVLFSASKTDPDFSLSGYWDFFRTPITALALARENATISDTCDAHMTYAYVGGLMYNVSSDDVAKLWETAQSACPGDVTAQVESAKASLLGNGPGIKVNYTDNVEEFVSIAQAVVTQFPNVPASYLVLGDFYRALDHQSNVGPFTHRYFQQQAIQAYSEAANMTNDPSPLVSLADAYISAGNLDGATQVLSDLSENIQKMPEPLAIGAALSARRGDYEDALHKSIDAQRAASTLSVPVLAKGSTFFGCGDVTNVLSLPLGAQRSFIMVVQTCSSSSATNDFGFVPVSRGNWDFDDDPLFGSSLAIRSVVRYAYLAKEWQEGLNVCNDSGIKVKLGGWGGFCSIFEYQTDPSQLTSFDLFQDLHRYYGNIDLALQVVQDWVSATPNDPVAYERLGEIYFLLERWEEAQQACLNALDAYTPAKVSQIKVASSPMSGPGWIYVRLAAIDRQLGHGSIPNETVAYPAQMMWVANNGCGQEDCNVELVSLDAYDALEDAQVYFDQGNFEDALTWSTFSINRRSELWWVTTDGSIYGAQYRGTGAAEQLASLSAFSLGQYEDALSYAQSAVELDPRSPLYQEAVAEAMRALGQNAPSPGTATSEASLNESPSPEASPSPEPGSPQNTTDPARMEMIEAYQSALENDPTLFSTWNNLGVIFAQDGQNDEAVDAFQQAVSVRPDYALAWFNLGVTLASRPGLTSFLGSQGAYGKSAQLDMSLKNQDPVLTFDDEVYRADIDVSKPIPPDWQLSHSFRVRATPLTIGLIAMMVVRGAWSLGQNWFTGRWAEGALHSWVTKPSRWRRFFTSGGTPWWTAIITFVSLLWLSGASGVRENIVLGVGFASLLAVHAVAPALASQQTPLRHTSFLPASLVTLILAPFGLGFAPPAPLADEQGSTPTKVLRSGLIVLAIAAVLFCCSSAITAVPLVRSAATGALVLVSSALVPVTPLDGSHLNLKPWANWTITVVIITLAVLFALGFI